jgi:hypothetical protein
LSFTVPSAEGTNDLIITMAIGMATKMSVNNAKGINNAQRFDRRLEKIRCLETELIWVSFHLIEHNMNYVSVSIKTYFLSDMSVLCCFN